MHLKHSDIWLVRAQAEADKQMDLLRLERSLGEAGWAEIQWCCLCVRASTKNNKTLWGMNQIRSDRDTKTHMLGQRVRSIISLPLFCSFFLVCVSFCHILLDYYSLTKETCNYSRLQVGYWFFYKSLFSERNILAHSYIHRCGWLASQAWMGQQMALPRARCPFSISSALAL